MFSVTMYVITFYGLFAFDMNSSKPQNAAFCIKRHQRPEKSDEPDHWFFCVSFLSLSSESFYNVTINRKLATAGKPPRRLDGEMEF